MRRLVRPVVLVVMIVTIVWAHHHFGRHLGRDELRALVAAAGPYGPVAFVGACIAGIFLHMPEIVLIAIGGMLFGGVRAFAYGWIASLIGTTATFVIVRSLARDHFQRLLAGRFPRLRALDERLARNGFVTVLALRLLLFLAPPLNWLLGATRVRTSHYVAGTALGIVPGMAATVMLADAATRRPAGTDGVSPALIVAGIFAAVVVITAVVASRRVLGREQPAPPA
jgi:uncharacterized membrane protein YdjX (TVP38/TMEM64 family)